MLYAVGQLSKTLTVIISIIFLPYDAKALF